MYPGNPRRNGSLPPVAQWEIVRTGDGQYRYVNHEAGLLTAGFGSEEGLRRNADIIRVDEKTFQLMRERYAKELPHKQADAAPKPPVEKEIGRHEFFKESEPTTEGTTEVLGRHGYTYTGRMSDGRERWSKGREEYVIWDPQSGTFTHFRNHEPDLIAPPEELADQIGMYHGFERVPAMTASKTARGLNIAAVLRAPKFASKNAPDPGEGKYDPEHEGHVREEMKAWAQYAEETDNTEDIKPFDPSGDYLCGTCDMRRGAGECMRVESPISFGEGGCRLYHLGDPETAPPMKKKFTHEESKYGEHRNGFGCHRCEYGGAADAPDAEGREGWCSFWGTHVDTMACCSEWDEDAEKDKEEKQRQRKASRAREFHTELKKALGQDERERTPTGDTPVHSDDYEACISCGEEFMRRTPA